MPSPSFGRPRRRTNASTGDGTPPPTRARTRRSPVETDSKRHADTPQAGGVCIQAQGLGRPQRRAHPLSEGRQCDALSCLPQDLCQCPHWGTVLKGSIHVRYADGREETVRAGDGLLLAPATRLVDEDYEAVEFQSDAGAMARSSST